MNWTIIAIVLLLLTHNWARAAILVTYRGDAPNSFGWGAQPTETGFDINNDSVLDFTFFGDYFVAGIQSYGINRFVCTLATGMDIGGSVTALLSGSIIGLDTALLAGSWHIHTDKGGGSMFDLNFGPNSLQFADAYIGVEFSAADGIHYGWIQYIGYSHPEKGLGRNLPGGFIDSWAWETRPGVPIIAGAVPEPSAALLLVAASLTLFRRQSRRSLFCEGGGG